MGMTRVSQLISGSESVPWQCWSYWYSCTVGTASCQDVKWIQAFA